jgi:tetratricopeptide (TPR) repeat protein
MVGHKYHYKAFISYSHRDKKHGEWLHKRLERYRFPKGLIGQQTKLGTVPDRLGRIFRDRDELPASDDLTKEVRKALEQSEFMIVICSPNAASSRWVNREIIDFKRMHGDKYVLPIIIDGDPFASDRGEGEAECFPPALRFKIGPDGMLSTQRAEPIAADIRKFADGEKRAFIKLVAGLVGVGLDEIIERDLRRKYQIVMGVTALSILAMIVMGSLTYEAVIARSEAEEQRALADVARSHAEFQRGEAEGLIEFMLTELRDKLKSVGRLDALGAVGERAVGYYGGQILETMPDASVGRSARAFLMLGEVQNSLGNSEEALKMFERAAKATGAALERDPNNFDRLFEHSQSVFWIGYVSWQRGEHQKTEPLWREYERYARQMVKLEPENLIGHTELGYATGNIGTLLLENLSRPEEALNSFRQSLAAFQRVSSRRPEDIRAALNVADKHAWIADCLRLVGHLKDAQSSRFSQLEILGKLRMKEPENKDILKEWSIAVSGMALYSRVLTFKSDLASYKASIMAARDLVAYDPSNQEWLKNLVTRLILLTNEHLIDSSYNLAQQNLSEIKTIVKPLLTRVDSNEQLTFWVTLPLMIIEAELASHTKRNLEHISRLEAMAAKLKHKSQNNILAEGEEIFLLRAFQVLARHHEKTGDVDTGNLYRWNIYRLTSNSKYYRPDILLLKFNALLKIGRLKEAELLKNQLIERGVALQYFI